jgi:anti-sigma factor RsiW
MNTKLPVEAHLAEEVLVRFLDGELDKRANEIAARHLDACWTCRAKREQLRQAMDRFVQMEEALIDASITAPPFGWAGFRDKINIANAQVRCFAAPSPRQFTRALGMIGAAFAAQSQAKARGWPLG